MSALRSQFLSLIAVVAAVSSSAIAQGQSIAPNPSHAGSAALPATGLYFTIVGEIRHPGVYELPQPQVRLTDLVKLSGGLTESSNRNILFYRRGRAGQSVYFTPDSEFQVQAGDILFVDGRGRDGRQRVGVRSVSHSTRDVNAKKQPATPELTHVVLIGLIERPIVVPLSPQGSVLQTLLTLLRQDRAAVREAMVFAPRQAPVHYTSEQQEPLRLINGTIVVFDSRDIIRETLPTFPPTIRSTAQVTSATRETPRVASPKIIRNEFPPAAPQAPAAPALPAVSQPTTDNTAVTTEQPVSPVTETPSSSPAPMVVPQEGNPPATAPTDPATNDAEGPSVPADDGKSAGVEEKGLPGPHFGQFVPSGNTRAGGTVVGHSRTARPEIRTISNSRTSRTEPQADRALARIAPTHNDPPAAESATNESRPEQTAPATDDDEPAIENDANDTSVTDKATTPSIAGIARGQNALAPLLVLGLCVISVAVIGWMYRDLRRLRQEVALTQESTNEVHQILYGEIPLREEPVGAHHDWNYQGYPQFAPEQRLDRAHVTHPADRWMPAPHAAFDGVAEQEWTEEELSQDAPLVEETPRSERTHRVDSQSGMPRTSRATASSESTSQGRGGNSSGNARATSTEGILDRVLAKVRGGDHARRS